MLASPFLCVAQPGTTPAGLYLNRIEDYEARTSRHYEEIRCPGCQ